MESLEFVSSLGFPIWFLMIVVSFYFLHRTGVLTALGDQFRQTLGSMQSTHSKLMSKTLDQNGMLINIMTDKLLSDVDTIKDRQIRIDTKFSFVIHALESAARDGNGGEAEYKNFGLISELQDRLSELEGKVK